jgi:hypothetical protein
LKKPYWVLENIDQPARRHLLKFGGIEWQATRYACLSPLTFGACGLLAAAFLGKLSLDPSSWLTGLVYGLLFYSTNFVHTLGHLLSGNLVGQPMQANLLTATFDVNIYAGNQSGYTRRVHLGRALGGPLLNMLVGLLCLAAGGWTGGWLKIAGLVHLASALWTSLPIAPMDGWVIQKYLRSH